MLKKYLDYMRERTRAHVGNRTTWMAITHLAKELLRRGTLSRKEVLQSIRDGHAAGIPLKYRKYGLAPVPPRAVATSPQK